MAVSVKELIEQKEAIEKRKAQLFDLETSVGIITVKQPSRTLAADLQDMEDSDPYVIIECTVNPNLKDKSLLDAYGCLEPIDIAGKLFKAGEVNAIARKIMELAGYRKDIRSELHEAVKN